LDVTDPVAGKTFPLYDFELSMARMLDGRRRYSEVAEAGQRLGIPVNFESLHRFVRQLEAYGFLEPLGSQLKPNPEDSTWPPRRKWDEALRALFQSGLQMHRQGRYFEAANYFEAMLEQDPENKEALEMLDQARQRIAGKAGAEGSPSDSSQVSLIQLLSEEAPLEDAPLFLEPPGADLDLSSAPLELSPEPRVPVSKPRITAGALTVHPVESKWKKPALVGGGVLVLAAGLAAAWFFFFREAPPTNTSLRASRQLSYRRNTGTGASTTLTEGRVFAPSAVGQPDAGTAAVAAATSPNTGTVNKAALAAVASPNAGTVDKTPLSAATSPNAGAENKAPVAAVISPDAGTANKATVASIEAVRPRESSVAIADGGQSVAALAQPKASESPPAVQRQWISAKIERRRRARRGDVEAPVDGVISWQVEAQQRVKRGEPIGTLQEKSTKRKHVLVAPKDGVLMPRERSGANAKKSKRVATILAPEGYLQAFVSKTRPERSWSCELFHEASGMKAPCKVVTVITRGSRYKVTATTEAVAFDTVEGAVLRLAPPP
jgi:hypothetical protein